jgi:hypothetical protein
MTMPGDRLARTQEGGMTAPVGIRLHQAPLNPATSSGTDVAGPRSLEMGSLARLRETIPAVCR